MSQQPDGGLGSPLDAYDPETLRLASEQLLLDAHEARLDPKKFFSFVMRAETGDRLPLVALPHQRLHFDFMMAHKRCLCIMPVGTSKTLDTVAMTLWLLGSDVTARGAVISGAQGQAIKVVSAVSDYITESELSAGVNLVFPKLRPSQRPKDPWTQIAITIDRPAGIRDPSLVAVGIGGALPGARLSWVVVDDILDQENTTTNEAMEKTFDFLESTVFPRLDPDGRCVVTNTPWAAADITQRLQEAPYNWPTMIMDVEGNVEFKNVDSSWDSPELRPSTKQKGDVCRLVEHDPDPEEKIPLWPEKYSREVIDEKRNTTLPHRYNQLYMCKVRDNAKARCKQEWIDKCLRNGRGLSLVLEYKGSNLVVTGVDLAFSEQAGSGKTAFVTVEILPNSQRVLLDIESGQWDSPTVLKMLIAKQAAFGSMVLVENNGAQQAVLQFARAVNVSLPVRGHTTGRNKANPVFGVESLFAELMNGAWTFPCDHNLQPSKSVKTLIAGLLSYEPPPKHTPDEVMAMWFAREMARKLGNGQSGTVGQAIGRSIMER